MDDYSGITQVDFSRAVLRQGLKSVEKNTLCDTTNQQELEVPKIQNTGTLNAFVEDKVAMPVFKTITELRKDLLA